MKLFIDGSLRGAITRLIPFWKEQGIDIVDNVKSADVQLSIARISTSSPNTPSVLRLDGVYYDKDIDFERRNSSISRSHKSADAVIYQSKMAQRMAEEHLSKRRGFSRIIYNGVEEGWNNPVEHKGINIMCCAKWRRLKRLKEIIDVFNKFNSHYPDSKLHVVGGFKNGGVKISNPNVKYYGMKSFDEMKEIYRRADIFIHLCKKDSCPSAVAEAIAAGIPVVTTNACGGATEMCDMTDGCVVVPGEEESLKADYIYREEYNKMPKDVLKNIVSEMRKIAKTKRRVEIPRRLTAEYAAKRYKEVMEEVIKR